MDPMTLGFGVVAIGFGSYTSFLRAKKPEKHAAFTTRM